tara:strand:+ start:392 stop:526 length:135 start_codon:yes stop_codon:yes gene_type:complete
MNIKKANKKPKIAEVTIGQRRNNFVLCIIFYFKKYKEEADLLKA